MLLQAQITLIFVWIQVFKSDISKLWYISCQRIYMRVLLKHLQWACWHRGRTSSANTAATLSLAFASLLLCCSITKPSGFCYSFPLLTF